jgi:prepilin-type N-terminal cleavage/methylation domain-containing protein
MELYKKIMKKFNNKRGFTLVELLIAMAIFVLFISVLINTYSYIVQAQRKANDERVVYVEARKVFDIMLTEFRDGMVDYAAFNKDICSNGATNSFFGPKDEVKLVSKDDSVKTRIWLLNNQVMINKDSRHPVTGTYANTNSDFAYAMTINPENILVQELAFYVAPSIDPYDICTVLYDQNQFHPMVTIYAEFLRVGHEDEEPLIIQTSISSRVYNKIYES